MTRPRLDVDISHSSNMSSNFFFILRLLSEPGVVQIEITGCLPTNARNALIDLLRFSDPS